MSICCKCALNPNLRYVEKEILLGRKSIAWGATQLGVPYQTMWTHIKEHTTKPEEAKEVSTLTEVLDELKEKLRKYSNTLLDQPVSPANARPVGIIVNAINTTIMNIAKLQKIISVAPTIEIHNVQLQMTKLQEFMITQLCSECQRKAIKFLEVSESG